MANPNTLYDDAEAGQKRGWGEDIPFFGGMESGSRQEATQADAVDRLGRALDGYGNIKAPDLQGSDAYWKGVGADPQGIAATKAGLAHLLKLGTQGGQTQNDIANQGRTNLMAADAAHANQSALMQAANQRGQGGSSLMLANSLLNEQNDANQGAQNQANTAGNNYRRGLSALTQAGQAAGNLSNQSYNQAARKAQALSQIDQFNQQMKNQNFGNQLGQANLQVGNVQDYNSAITGGSKQASADASANRENIGNYFKSLMEAAGG